MNFEPLLPQLGNDQLGITKDDDDDGSDGDDDGGGGDEDDGSGGDDDGDGGADDVGDGDSDDDALLSAGEPKPFNFYWHLKPFWAHCLAKVVLMQALCKRMLIE